VDAAENGDEVRHDDAQQAAAELRALFRTVVADPEADAGADLRLGRTGTEYGEEAEEEHEDRVELGMYLVRDERLDDDLDGV
jgi:hypothetical protein